MLRAIKGIIFVLVMSPVFFTPAFSDGSTDAPGPAARRLIIVSWDGAADWVIDKLLAEGKLPNVARMANMGVRAEYSTPAYPSKTACGHAAIWTGAYSDVNGITSNAVPLLPRADHTALESRSGFDSASLLAEPLWITAAKAGKRVVALSATQSSPSDRDLATIEAERIAPDRLITINGFESEIDPGKMLTGADLKPAVGWQPMPKTAGKAFETSFDVGESTFFVLVFDDPADPVKGADSMLVRQGGKVATGATAEALLKPAAARDDTSAWSRSFRVTKGDLFSYTYLRLFSLDPATHHFELYQRAAYGLRGIATKEQIEGYFAAYGGFHDDLFWKHYTTGELGKPIWDGGDGTAERRVVETVRLDVEFLKRGTRYAFTEWKPDVLFHYTPLIDSAGHTWIGVMDPASPRYDPAIAAKYWPYYEAIVELEDDWLGDMLHLGGDDTLVCLVSDHGMQGTDKQFNPNAVLEQAGLLTLKDGRIDLSASRAFVPSWGDFAVRVNTTDWKGGIVPPEDTSAVVERARRALLAATDPENGRQIVVSAFAPEEVVGLGIGGPTGGDLYYDVAPGYYPLPKDGAPMLKKLTRPIGAGDHGYFPLRRSMQAIFYLSGPGVANGAQIPGVRQIDIAPTLSRLLGIPPPRDAVGRVVYEALK